MAPWRVLVAGAAAGAAVAALSSGCMTAEPRAAVGSGTPDAPRSSQSPSGTARVRTTVPGVEAGARRPVGSEAWRLTRPAPAEELGAYATAAGGLPGSPLELKVSTTAERYRVTVYRIGAYRGGSGAMVHRTSWLPGRLQPGPVLRPEATRTVVAPWRVDLALDTDAWRPGFHVVKVVTGRGSETLVPYVVSSPSSAGTVALVAPVTTWQAYNGWGGYSLYAGAPGDRRAHAVSFDRPYVLSPGANDFRTAVVPIVVRAERLGVPLSYFTNVDLHLRPLTALRGARAWVSMGHDEYWTTTMRRVVTRARDAGTNLAVLGANTMYWRVRLEDAGTGPARLMVGYRDDAHLDPMWSVRPTETTARFRDDPSPRPEHGLLGMQYECYPVDTDYVVLTPGWWGFRGTGVARGDRIPRLVGPEADRVYPDRRSPRPLQVLSDSTYDCRGVTTRTQSVYFTAPSGAAVFNAGTLRWGCALVDRCERPLGGRTARFTARVTDNVLREFATGPVGGRLPARHNVDELGLSPVNSVSAS